MGHGGEGRLDDPPGLGGRGGGPDGGSGHQRHAGDAARGRPSSKTAHETEVLLLHHLLQHGDAAVGDLPDYRHQLVDSPGLPADQLATAGVEGGGVAHQEDVAPGLLRGLQGALSDEEISDEKLLAALLGVVQLLAGDVRLVARLHVVAGSQELLGGHPARHLVLVPGQPLKQTRLDVDFQPVLDAQTLK